MRCISLTRLLLCLLPVLAAGCGHDSGPAVVPVTGRVTLDQRPLARATVRFQPVRQADETVARPESIGVTDEEGNFVLRSLAAAPGIEGAVPGAHKVQVSLLDRGGARAAPRQLVPDRYSRQSILTYTVPPEGAKDVKFELTSK